MESERLRDVLRRRDAVPYPPWYPWFLRDDKDLSDLGGDRGRTATKPGGIELMVRPRNGVTRGG